MSPKLHLIHGQGAEAASASTANEAYCGRQYRIKCEGDCTISVQHGVVGDYQVSGPCGRVTPIETKGEAVDCFFYDSEPQLSAPGARLEDGAGESHDPGSIRLLGNRAHLEEATMEAPLLVEEASGQCLRIEPGFSLHYKTDAFAAQLGALHLVQSQRSVLLEDSRQIPLLHAEEPVLYLEGAEDAEPIAYLQGAQARGESADYHYSLALKQAIPERVEGAAVESVTVLEQYHTYFMQRELADDGRPVIWTPLLAPITWGWSIRVGRRADGEWGILRQKLIRPTVGHDGLELPQWNSNTALLRQSLNS